MNLSTSDLRPSVRAASRGSSNVQLSSALAASMRLSQHDSPSLTSSYRTSALIPENDVEHLELRQDLIDRESLLLLQQQRERLTDAQIEARRKEALINSLQEQNKYELSKSRNLESTLARVSTKKLALERENEEKATKLELERLQNDRMRREKMDLDDKLRATREKLAQSEEKNARTSRRVADLEVSVSTLERTRQEQERSIAHSIAESAALRKDLARSEREAQDNYAKLLAEKAKLQILVKRLSQALEDKNWTEVQLARFLDERKRISDITLLNEDKTKEGRKAKVLRALKTIVTAAAFVGRLQQAKKLNYKTTDQNTADSLTVAGCGVRVPLPKCVRDVRSGLVSKVDIIRVEGQENMELAQKTLMRADSDAVKANTRITSLEDENASLRARLTATESRLDAEVAMRSRVEKDLVETSKDRRNLEYALEEKSKELTRSQIEHKEKVAQLNTTRRVVDALAQENLQKQREQEAKERELREARIALEMERSERELKARQRLHVLEDRAVLEENVASQVDRLTTDKFDTTSSLYGSSTNLNSSYSRKQTVLASPLAVSRASGKMTKGEIKQLINTLDRSIADSPY